MQKQEERLTIGARAELTLSLLPFLVRHVSVPRDSWQRNSRDVTDQRHSLALTHCCVTARQILDDFGRN